MGRLHQRYLFGFSLVYAVLIWLDVQLALVRSDTLLVWFATGLSIGGVLVFGNRALWPILFGALVGCSVVCWQLGLEPYRLITVTMLFAFSAVGQAWLAGWLVRRFGRSLPPASLRWGLHTCGLLALAVLPAPVLWLTVLTALDVVVVSDLWIVALQWWLNLLTGVWLVAPWVVLGVTYWRRKPIREPWLWPVSSLLLALLLFTLQLVWRDAQQRYATKVQSDAAEIVSVIDDRLLRYEQAMQSLSAFFYASQSVEQHEFSAFGRTILEQLPAVQSVGWVRRVRQAERLNFEYAQQERGIPDFVIREPGVTGPPAAVRDEYYPLTYVEPFATRRALLGMDMAMEPYRRDALHEARDSGQVVMTGPIQPYATDVESPAVLLIMPVYTSGPPPQTVEERRQRIQGVVLMLVSPAELLKQALQPIAAPDIDILLIDASVVPPRPLAFYSLATTQVDTLPDPVSYVREAIIIQELSRYGRVWQVAFRPGPTYPQRWLNEDAIWRSVLAVGSVAIFFLFVGVRQRHEVRQRRLTRTYALLSAINQMIIREREPLRIFQAVCQIAVKQGGFRMAWVGLRNTTNNRLEPIVVAGKADDYLAQLDILLTEDNPCPTAQALLLKQAIIVNDVANDQRVAIWREAALRLGYRASASFPILVDGEVYATLSLYAAQPGFFDTAEVHLLNELVQDIAFAIVVRRQEAQLRASEQRNHLIVSTLPDIVFRLNREGRIIDVAAGNTNSLLKPPAEILNQTLEDLSDVLSSEMISELRSALTTAFATGELQTVAYKLLFSGQERFFEARIKAIPTGDEAIVLVRDITAWRVAELQLQAERDLLAQRVAERTAELSRANAELARSVRVKDEFLANMSHELRTPLNTILTLSESLLEELRGPLNERQRASIQLIETSGRHLLTLINDILDVAKIEAGRMELVKEVVAVSDVCESSLVLIKEQAAKKQIRLHCAIDVPQTRFLADPRRLKQILVNLLSNAVKFTPEGGSVELRVTTDTAQGTIAFAVSDTGIGIAPDQLPRLFQPFVQLDSSLTRQHEGSGLGLALVRRLVDLHGGSVSVTSTPGSGSVFTVTLPYQPLQYAVPNPAANDPLPPVRSALIIESSAVVAEQLARYLAEQNIQPVVWLYGNGAVEQVAAMRPDLIVLSVEIPDRSGWEILADLQRDPELRRIPVIVVSVVDEPERGFTAGAAAYLVKPITRAMLQQALSQISFSAVLPAEPVVGKGSSARVLVAEDHEMNLMVLREYLQVYGYEVCVARNGREALQMAAEWRPDLIIMDIQMPELDGLEAIRQLRAQAAYATTPIIAVTALAMPGDREQCLLAGATDYLTKPISLRRLARHIERLLTHSQHAR